MDICVFSHLHAFFIELLKCFRSFHYSHKKMFRIILAKCSTNHKLQNNAKFIQLHQLQQRFGIFETAANIKVCTDETLTSHTVCMHFQRQLGISHVQ